MAATSSSFRYVEYSGDDAADVLVTLIMNLTHPNGGAEPEGDVHEAGSTTEVRDAGERIIGFVPNQGTGEEDEDE